MNHQLNLKRQLRCIYLSDFFSGLRITDAVWVALLALFMHRTNIVRLLHGQESKTYLRKSQRK